MEKAEKSACQLDDIDWADRSEFWRNLDLSSRGRKKKFKFREPLILCGHGVRIRVDHRTLLIRNGFTHYPQKAEEIRLFPGDANMPDRIIVIDGSGNLTLDALSWMSEQNVEFVRLDWRGEISSIAGKSGYCANPKLLEKQQAIRGTKKELELASWLIREKLLASIETLKITMPDLPGTKIAISRIKKFLVEIRKPERTNSISKILGIEGAAAQAYFQAWQGIPLNWKKSGRKPIPANWHQFGPRTMGWRKRAYDAQHPINAMLNYGYGILKCRLRGEVVAAGLDPSIGIIHGNSENRIPLVYDLMEPQRPKVDRAIVELVSRHTFAPTDFTITKWGGCRLSPQLARALIRPVLEIEREKYSIRLMRIITSL